MAASSEWKQSMGCCIPGHSLQCTWNEANRLFAFVKGCSVMLTLDALLACIIDQVVWQLLPDLRMVSFESSQCWNEEEAQLAIQ